MIRTPRLPAALIALIDRLGGLTQPALPGLALGALFFAAALTPSLIPRSGALQGVLAGAAFAVGYGLGAGALALWRVLALPRISPGTQATARRWLIALALLYMLFALTQAGAGQDALHAAMGMEPVETVRPLTIAGVAALVAGLLIVLGRLFGRANGMAARWLGRIMPERVAAGLGFVLALMLFFFIGNDIMLRRILGALDAGYAAIDAALADDDAPPANPWQTGGPGSLIPWESLGAEGRNRVRDPLDMPAIAALTQNHAHPPLRIYVGLQSAPTPEARAELALAEAIRVGAFDRGTLVIATPTGTGWIDPASVYPLEALTAGDVATISVQYSYLPSWLSLLVAPEYGAENARAVYAAIHGHWRSLPEASRPRLYLHGLSLGSLNSDLSADFYDFIGAPHDGSFWVGPPFASRSWRQITADRQPDSPAWLPRFRDGSVVRFLNHEAPAPDGAPWGPMRIVYLQYASDAITFFAPDIFWREPDWMRGERGPGVIEEFRWMPVVTGLQVVFDLLTSTTAPRGYGHYYAGEDYLAGWLALLGPGEWDAAGLDRIRAGMAARGL